MAIRNKSRVTTLTLLGAEEPPSGELETPPPNVTGEDPALGALVGRSARYLPAPTETHFTSTPLAAVVTRAHEDGTLDLSVFAPPDGRAYVEFVRRAPRERVELV